MSEAIKDLLAEITLLRAENAKLKEVAQRYSGMYDNEAFAWGEAEAEVERLRAENDRLRDHTCCAASGERAKLAKAVAALERIVGQTGPMEQFAKQLARQTLKEISG